MSTIINTQLKNISDSDWAHLKDAHPDATVRIDVQDPNAEMNDEAFWAVVDQLDFGRKANTDILVPAIHALSRYDVQGVYRFEDILTEKLRVLDGERFAGRLGWGTDVFSVDGFLYARCCVVANGRGFYEKVLADPAQMPATYTFEPLLSLAERAYQLKTGRDDYDYLPPLSYETFANKTGWPNGPHLEDLLSG
ncbi:MAG: DUF4240 domain-containing protein [Saprospiraceae bacterium]